MKKFAVFYAPSFKAKCGWKDFKGSFDDFEEAAGSIPHDQAYWWQIVDTDKWEIRAEQYNDDFFNKELSEKNNKIHWIVFIILVISAMNLIVTVGIATD
jgi:hypothetical protein